MTLDEFSERPKDFRKEAKAAAARAITVEEYRAVEAEKQRQRDARVQQMNNKVLSDASRRGKKRVAEHLLAEWSAREAEEKKKWKRTLTTDEIKDTYIAISEGDPVIVRTYESYPFRKGEDAFRADAAILGRHGYVPSSQSFAANNVLTGVAIGTGNLTVSYIKRT